jgi:VPS28 protein
MFSLDEETKLYSTNAEREKYETQATLFGIIVTLDYLERAYIRDSITAVESLLSLFQLILANEQQIYASLHSIVESIQDNDETRVG